MNASITGTITVVGESIPGTVEEVEEEKIGLLKWLKELFVDLYYIIFPAKLEAKFDAVKAMDVAHDQEELEFWLEVVGPKAFMQKVITESEGGYSIDCHTEAHEVGRTAYLLFGAESYGSGDASCHSGYYHGVMETFIADVGTEDLTTKIIALCDAFDTNFGTFECLHGIGHGLMAYESYDLIASLEGCEELDTVYEQRSCYGGAFMENIVAGQGNGAIEGHETEWIDRTRPHFPCDSIGDSSDRIIECYKMQTSWMLEVYGYDYERVVSECGNVDEQYRRHCYVSFGRDMAGLSLRDPHKMIQTCDAVPREDDYYWSCISGGVFVILDFWGPNIENQADEFCELVESTDERNRCESTKKSRKIDRGPIEEAS